MSHEIDTSTGQPAVATAGERPWHDLGPTMQPGASIEEWLEAARMTYILEKCPIFVKNGGMTQYQKTVALVRNDTHEALSLVGEKYKIVQPREVLEFFRDLTSDMGFELESAGALFGGRMYWALAKIGHTAKIRDRDEVHGYLQVATTCDGSASTTAQYAGIRTVCANTISMNLGEATNQKNRRVSVSHKMQFNPRLVKEKLGIAEETFYKFMAQMESLQNVTLPREEAANVLIETLNISMEGGITLPELEIKNKGIRTMLSLFDGAGKGADMAGQTAWGLVNAVTEYYDHHRSTKTTDARMYDAWFGDGEKIKAAVAEKLLARV